MKFAVLGEPNTFVVIWTTTPWTLPANLAVAYNEKLQYVQAKVGEENYILFRGLLPTVAEKCGWTNYTETPVATDDLAQLQYQHPFCNRTGKAFAADFEPKPAPQTYRKFLRDYAVDPARAAMFEDLARNLLIPHQLGMTTVLVVPDGTREVVREDWELEGRGADHVDHVTDDLTGFLEKLGATA